MADLGLRSYQAHHTAGDHHVGRDGPDVATSWKAIRMPAIDPDPRSGDYLATGVLVGRHPELAAVERLLERAEAGSGGLLVLHGPHGVGKSAVVAAAASRARDRGFLLRRAAHARRVSEALPWLSVLPDDAAAAVTTELLADPGPLALADFVDALVRGPRTLVVVEDVDPHGPLTQDLVALLAARLPLSDMVVLLTSTGPLSSRHASAVRPLSPGDLGQVLAIEDDDIRYAVWLASGGLPGPAFVLVRDLILLPPPADPVAHLALAMPRSGGFFEVDHGLVRLLETALARPVDDVDRARLLGRLAVELLPDITAGARRRRIADDALALSAGAPPAVRAEVLADHLHALWDPEAATARLATAQEIVRMAQAGDDPDRARSGLFWIFFALMELGRIREAESALATYARLSAAAGDVLGSFRVTSRRAMLAILRGRFADAQDLIAQARQQGTSAGIEDTGGLVLALQATITGLRYQPDEAADLVPGIAELARRVPGQYFDVLAAAWLAVAGRDDEAAAEIDRVLSQVLAGSGPNWVWGATQLALTATLVGHAEAAAALYPALRPYAGRTVTFASAANMGPVDHYLGMLATLLARSDEAVGHLSRATAWEAEVGALPWLAHSLAALADALTSRGEAGDLDAASVARRRARDLAERLDLPGLLTRLTPPADEWSLVRDGGDWVLKAGSEHARIRDALGIQQLRMLLSSPRHDVSALDLAAGGAGLQVADNDRLLDRDAIVSYRAHLGRLDGLLEQADAIGDIVGSERLASERDAILAELRHATGLAGRVRQTTNEAERARVNVTRTVRSALQSIALVAPKAAAHLTASVRTGLFCRYDPVPGGPVRWHL